MSNTQAKKSNTPVESAPKRKKNVYILNVGSMNTIIYQKGVVFCEPTITIAKRNKGLEVVSAGNEVANSDYLSQSDCTIIAPIEDDVIVNNEVTSMMLRGFFSRSLPKNPFKPLNIYVMVPCGATVSEREAIENAVIKAGKKNVIVVETLKSLCTVAQNGACVGIVIGEGSTDVGIVNKDGIIAGCTVNIGCEDVDKKIIERVLDVYNLIISKKTAYMLRRAIGGLFENDISTVSVIGKDILDGKVKKIEISSESILPAITYCYKRILDVAESAVTLAPATVINEVTTKGIYFAGEGAGIKGLEEYSHKYLKIPTTVVEDPETFVYSSLYYTFAE